MVSFIIFLTHHTNPLMIQTPRAYYVRTVTIQAQSIFISTVSGIVDSGVILLPITKGHLIAHDTHDHATLLHSHSFL